MSLRKKKLDPNYPYVKIKKPPENELLNELIELLIDFIEEKINKKKLY